MPIDQSSVANNTKLSPFDSKQEEAHGLPTALSRKPARNKAKKTTTRKNRNTDLFSDSISMTVEKLIDQQIQQKNTEDRKSIFSDISQQVRTYSAFYRIN